MKPLDRQVIISKVNRFCNKVAHGLCQLSRSVLCSGILQGAVPNACRKRPWIIVTKTLLFD
jgi:hypothetical protein